VLVPVSTVAKLPANGRPAKLFTRLVVREDAMVLFGFASPDERELFDLLTAVTGVGPKMGLAFLSALAPESLRRAVAAGDVDALTVVPGVGKKVAQRIVIDLKDRLGGDVVVIEGPMSDVREALLSLGLSPQEASEAMAGIAPGDDRAVEDLLRDALQRAGR
jgi:Holliday junction DNA helicase RuvA